MKRTANHKHRRYSAVEKSSLLEAYKNSGTLKKQWCTENDIGLSTLQKWLREDKRQEQSPNVQAWCERSSIMYQKWPQSVPLFLQSKCAKIRSLKSC